jgi:hypothetical protein
MKKGCPYLARYKEIDIPGEKVVIYKCVLGNTFLKSSDLKKNWACRGCIIPWIINNRPCKHLQPGKNFLIRGSSQTWFSCTLLDVVMDYPDFCMLKCKLYQLNNIL